MMHNSTIPLASIVLDVTDYKGCLKYFADKARIPDHRLSDIRKYQSQIAKAIQGKAQSPISAPPVFGELAG